MEEQKKQKQDNFDLTCGTNDLYYALASSKPLIDALQDLGVYLRQKRKTIHPSGQVFPIYRESPAILTIHKNDAFIPIQGPLGQSQARGHIFSEFGMTRNWPLALDLGETKVSFARPKALPWKINIFHKLFRLFDISVAGDVVEKFTLTEKEIKAFNLRSGQEEGGLMEEEVMEIRKRKSSSPHEPELDRDQEEDFMQVKVKKQGMDPDLDLELELELTKSQKELLMDLTSTSGGPISLSSESKNLLIQIQTENKKLHEEVTELRQENQQLKRQLEESTTKSEEAIKKLTSKYDEVTKLLEDLNVQKKKKVKPDSAFTSELNESINPNSSDSFLCQNLLNQQEVKQKQKTQGILFRTTKTTAKEKMIEEEEKKLEQAEVDPDPVDPVWKKKLQVRVLGNVEGEGRENRSLAFRLDEELIDLYLQTCQRDYADNGIFFFTTKKISPVLSKGSSLIRYTEDFSDMKSIVCPIPFQGKESKDKTLTWGLLIVWNERGNWFEPPFNIDAFYFDGLGAEPSGTTAKILKYILDCCKIATQSKSTAFGTDIKPKRFIVPKQSSLSSSRDSACWLLLFLNHFLLMSDKKKFLSSKSISKAKDLDLFREELYNALIASKS